jgi:integrase
MVGGGRACSVVQRARHAVHSRRDQPPGEAPRRRRQAIRFPDPLSHAPAFLRLALANAGHDTRAIQDYLGHKAIQHTVRYTELAPTKFKDFWR